MNLPHFKKATLKLLIKDDVSIDNATAKNSSIHIEK